MRLYNSKDLDKMRVKNSYRLSLQKLETLLISHAGHVALCGDKYFYNAKPIATLNHAAGCMLIELFEPVFPDRLLLPDEKSNPPSQLSVGQSKDNFDFIIGSQCKEEFDKLLDHIKLVNDDHVYRSHFHNNLHANT